MECLRRCQVVNKRKEGQLNPEIFTCCGPDGSDFEGPHTVLVRAYFPQHVSIELLGRVPKDCPVKNIPVGTDQGEAH
jgi:hypothetical protein